jgi:hypothetical protein
LVSDYITGPQPKVNKATMRSFPRRTKLVMKDAMAVKQANSTSQQKVRPSSRNSSSWSSSDSKSSSRVSVEYNEMQKSKYPQMELRANRFDYTLKKEKFEAFQLFTSL